MSRSRKKSADEQWELPDLPAIDDRAMRRAIRRGVLRTAAVGAVYLLIGAFIVSIAVGLLLSALGREGQLDRIAIAWQVAHPEYATEESGSGSTMLGRYVQLDARLSTEPADPAAVSLRLSQDLFGRVSTSTSLPQSPAFNSLSALGLPVEVTDKGQELTQLARLPETTTVSAVLSFAQPLDEQQLTEWLTRAGSPGELVTDTYLMTAAYSQNFVVWNGVLQSPVYGWNLTNFHETGNWTVVSGFRKWVSELHNSDSSNLHRMGLDLGRLRAAARAGLVHGVIVTGLTPKQLAKLLQTPQVRAAHVYHIGFSTIS